MDPGYQLGRVLAARISAAEKEKILYGNAARLDPNDKTSAYYLRLAGQGK